MVPPRGRVVVATREALICDRWPLVLPDFRAEFHEARPTWEIGRLQDARERVRPGSVVYDVGAEHGDFTALYASWGARVVPVECADAYWPCIEATYRANGLPDPESWVRGFAGAQDAGNHRLRIGRSSWPLQAMGPVVADPGFAHLAQQADSIPVFTLDTIAKAIDLMPDTLMIDVEGAEWHVLAGAYGLLRDRSMTVYVSVHEPTMGEWYNRTLDDLHALMGLQGYVGVQLPAHGEIETFWRYTC